MTRADSNLASRLKHRITIEQPVLTPDNAGGYSQSWNMFAQVWADVMPKNANEKLQHEQVSPINRTIFVTRFLTGVTEGMRVSFGSRKFNILGVLNPYEEDVLLEVTTEEVAV